jgi:predicted phage-related endonuclease
VGGERKSELVTRRKYVREIRREQRNLERKVNVLERHLLRALSKKRLINWKDAERFLEDWKEISNQFEDVYKKLRAFTQYVRI